MGWQKKKTRNIRISKKKKNKITFVSFGFLGGYIFLRITKEGHTRSYTHTHRNAHENASSRNKPGSDHALPGDPPPPKWREEVHTVQQKNNIRYPQGGRYTQKKKLGLPSAIKIACVLFTQKQATAHRRFLT